MNKGDVYMAQIKNESVRPVIVIDSEFVKALTTKNIKGLDSCMVKGKEHFVIPEKIRFRDIVLCDYVETIK